MVRHDLFQPVSTYITVEAELASCADRLSLNVTRLTWYCFAFPAVLADDVERKNDDPHYTSKLATVATRFGATLLQTSRRSESGAQMSAATRRSHTCLVMLT